MHHERRERQRRRDGRPTTPPAPTGASDVAPGSPQARLTRRPAAPSGRSPPDAGPRIPASSAVAGDDQARTLAIARPGHGRRSSRRRLPVLQPHHRRGAVRDAAPARTRRRSRASPQIDVVGPAERRQHRRNRVRVADHDDDRCRIERLEPSRPAPADRAPAPARSSARARRPAAPPCRASAAYSLAMMWVTPAPRRRSASDLALALPSALSAVSGVWSAFSAWRTTMTACCADASSAIVSSAAIAAPRIRVNRALVTMAPRGETPPRRGGAPL